MTDFGSARRRDSVTMRYVGDQIAETHPPGIRSPITLRDPPLAPPNHPRAEHCPWLPVAHLWHALILARLA